MNSSCRSAGEAASTPTSGESRCTNHCRSRSSGETAASSFAVATSGGVVLYNARGRLLFKGGITAARGHEGDSFGQERIASLLTTGAADRAAAPVFGCALEDEPPARMARAETFSTDRGGER